MYFDRNCHCHILHKSHQSGGDCRHCIFAYQPDDESRMETTTSLVMKVAGNGRWKGKVGNYNFCWILSELFSSGCLLDFRFKAYLRPQTQTKPKIPKSNQVKPSHAQGGDSRPYAPYLGICTLITCLNQIKSLHK